MYLQQYQNQNILCDFFGIAKSWNIVYKDMGKNNHTASIYTMIKSCRDKRYRYRFGCGELFCICSETKQFAKAKCLFIDKFTPSLKIKLLKWNISQDAFVCSKYAFVDLLKNDALSIEKEY